LKVRSVEDQRIHFRVCDFCGSDIWNRFYHCKKCNDFALCPLCVAEGRNCIHFNPLELYEYFNAAHLKEFEVRCTNCILNIKACLKPDETCNLDIFTIPGKNSIGSVAWLNATSPFEKFYCHNCKFFLDSNIKSVCSICKINYCGKCLWNNYQLRPLDIAMKDSDFECLRCQNKCICQSCLLERNESIYKVEVKSQLENDIFLNQFRVPNIILEEKPHLVPSVCDRISFAALSMSMKQHSK